MTPASGWGAYGGSFGEALSGYVDGATARLQGLARKFTSPAAGSGTFTIIPALPAEMRPPQTVVLKSETSSAAVTRVNVTAAGAVEVQVPAGQTINVDGYVSLSGLTWALT